MTGRAHINITWDHWKYKRHGETMLNCVPIKPWIFTPN
jgi:hypothetical protein